MGFPENTGVKPTPHTIKLTIVRKNDVICGFRRLSMGLGSIDTAANVLLQKKPLP
jgi:hypothetical protein